MSIQTLAKDLQLSISTVSRALNGYTDVAPATRERVILRAAALGYQAHPMARSLKSGKSYTIGVILPVDERGGQFINNLYSNLLGSVASVLELQGYTLLVTTHGSGDIDNEILRYEQLIRARAVDGFILVRTLVQDPRAQLLFKRSIPFVTYGRSQLATPHPWVDTDNEQAFWLATQRQIEHGHQAIALLNGLEKFTFAQLRRHGYERALNQAGIEINPHWIKQGDLTESAGYQLTRSLITAQKAKTNLRLETKPKRPSALVCVTDAIAIGAMAACREEGLTVGQDIAIIGYGNSEASRYSAPALTSIEHRIFENGQHLAHLLLAQLQNQHTAQTMPAPQHYLEPVELVVRESDAFNYKE